MVSEAVSARPIAKRRIRGRLRRLPAILGLLVVGGGGWWAWTNAHRSVDAASNLITTPVTRGDLLETVTATGSVTAQTGAEVKIGSQITGRIKRLYADVGSHVNAGQVIAELDLPDITAQLAQAEASLAAAQTRLLQQESGVGMQQTQSSSAVSEAQSSLAGAQARLASALAAARLQQVQTPNDILRAQNAVGVAQAQLATARSNEAQVRAGVNLQIANANDQISQASATAANTAVNLKRQTELNTRGFVATSVVDQARAADTVAQSQVSSARQNLELVKQKVAADVQSAHDAVLQAQQNVAAAQSALVAARAEPYNDQAKNAAVQDSRAQISTAQAALKLARGNTTQNTLKQEDVQQAREAVRVAAAQVDYYKAQVDKTSIRSPISGTVLQMAAQQGETLAAGLSAPTLIVVADLTKLQVDAFVDETDIGKIRIGQPAQVTVDAFPRHIFHGSVTKVASGSTIQQGVVTYDVTVALKDPKRQLKPDMTASVIVQTGSRPNVLLIPSEAVKMGARGGSVNVVVTTDGKKQVESRKVKTGGTDGVNTEITAGLKEGDVVVLAGATSGSTGGRGPTSPFGPSNNRKGGGGGGGGGRGG